MESKQISWEKMRQLRRNQKVYGVPVLPHRIDAMYDNVCRGNLVAYYLDSNPARGDPVYAKLKKMQSPNSWDSPSGSEKVAEHFMSDIIARQMNEKTYNYIRKTPSWFLKLEFAIRHERDIRLRRNIKCRHNYMVREKDKTWLDFDQYNNFK